MTTPTNETELNEMAATIKQVNKALEKAGIKAELVKGRGYFWFDGEGVECGVDGVYVSRVADLTVDEWVAEAKERAKI